MILSSKSKRGFTLLEMVFAIAVVLIMMLVLGKLLVDGIYLQRISGERANRTATITALGQRLRADALGAVDYEMTRQKEAKSLTLSTFLDGMRCEVQWIFRDEDVLRLVDGHETDGYASERLAFSATLEPGALHDILELKLTVVPPSRSRQHIPRISEEHFLLPLGSMATADKAEESRS